MKVFWYIFFSIIALLGLGMLCIAGLAGWIGWLLF